VIISHNLTITGNGSHDGGLAVIDYNYMQGRVRVLPGVVVTFRNIMFRKARARPGLSVDFYLSSPGAALVAVDAFLSQMVCVPTNLAQVLAQPRAPGWPGQQQAFASDDQICIRDKCWRGYVTYKDYAIAQVLPNVEGANEVRHLAPAALGHPLSTRGCCASLHAQRNHQHTQQNMCCAPCRAAMIWCGTTPHACASPSSPQSASSSRARTHACINRRGA
jgi:hypothetical protein